MNSLHTGNSADLDRSPLVIWIQSYFGTQKASTVELSNGIILNRILNLIDPHAFNALRIQNNGGNDISSRAQNLVEILSGIKRYYQEKLQQVVVMKMPDILLLAKESDSALTCSAMNDILLLVLGCAIQCDKKEEFIEHIKQLDVDVQRGLVLYIQEITENSDNVIPYRVNELADIPKEELLVLCENLYRHLQGALEQRDDYIETIIDFVLLQDGENCREKIEETPKFRPRNSITQASFHSSNLLQAKKETIRTLQSELDDQHAAIAEMKEEHEQVKIQLESIRLENKHLVNEAAWAKTYRDELDILKSQLENKNKLRAENARLKGLAEDADFYKKKYEELQNQSDLLYDSNLKLEHQAKDSAARISRHNALESENKRLSSQVNRMVEEQSEDQKRIRELVDEIAKLTAEKQESISAYSIMSDELDGLRMQKQDDGLNVPLMVEYNQSSDLLRLEKENKHLRDLLDSQQNDTNEARINDLDAYNQTLAENIVYYKNLIGKLIKCLILAGDINQNVAKGEFKKMLLALGNIKDSSQLDKWASELQTMVEQLAKKGILIDILTLKEAMGVHSQGDNGKCSNLLRESLEKKQGRIQELENNMGKLNELVRVNSQMKESIEEKDGKISSLESRVARLNESLENQSQMKEACNEKEEQISLLEKRLNELEDLRNADAAIKDKEIIDLKKSVAADKQLKEKMVKKEETIRHLKSELATIGEVDEQLKDRIVELEEQLILLRGTLAKKDLTIDQLEDDLPAKEEENLRLEKELTSKHEIISQQEKELENKEKLKNELSNKVETINVMMGKLNEKEALNLQMEGELAGRNETIHHLKDELSSRDEEILQLKTGQINQDEATHHLKKALTKKDDNIHQLKAELAKIDEVVSQLKEDLKNSEQCDQQFRDELSKKDKTILELEDEHVNKDEVTLQLKNELAQKDDELLTLKDELVDRDKVIYALKNELGNSDQICRQTKEELAKREEAVQKLEQELAATEKTILSFSDGQVSHETETVEMRDDLANKEKVIHQLKESLDKSKEQITHLNSQLGNSMAEKEKKETELKQSLEKSKEEITHLNSKLKISEAEKEKKETELKQSLDKSKEQITHLNSQIENSKAEKEKKETELKQSLDELNDLVNMNSELNDDLASKEKTIAELKKSVDKLKELKEKNNQLQDCAVIKDRKIALLEQGIENIEESVNGKGTLTSLINGKNDETTLLNDRIKELENQLERSEESCDEIKKNGEVEFKKLTERVSELQCNLTECGKLKSVLKDRENQISILQKDLDDYQFKAAQLEKKTEELKSAKTRTASASHQQEERLTTIKNQLEEYLARDITLSNELKMKEEKLKSVTENLEEMSKRNTSLEEEINNLEKDLEELRLTGSLKNITNITEKIKLTKRARTELHIKRCAMKAPPQQSNKLEVKLSKEMIEYRKVVENLHQENQCMEKQMSSMKEDIEKLSSENASLQMKNETKEGELNLLKLDHEAIQKEMAEAREHFQELDISATKIAHRCEVLVQLNATLEEENKAMMEQVNKLFAQNQDLLVTTLYSREQYIEDQRTFSEHIFELERDKEKLSDQVFAAERALQQDSLRKKGPFWRGTHKILKRAGFSKRKDSSKCDSPSEMNDLEVDTSIVPLRENRLSIDSLSSFRTIRKGSDGSPSISSKVMDHSTPIQKVLVTQLHTPEVMRASPDAINLSQPTADSPKFIKKVPIGSSADKYVLEMPVRSNLFLTERSKTFTASSGKSSPLSHDFHSMSIDDSETSKLKKESKLLDRRSIALKDIQTDTMSLDSNGETPHHHKMPSLLRAHDMRRSDDEVSETYSSQSGSLPFGNREQRSSFRRYEIEHMEPRPLPRTNDYGSIEDFLKDDSLSSNASSGRHPDRTENSTETRAALEQRNSLNKLVNSKANKGDGFPSPIVQNRVSNDRYIDKTYYEYGNV